MIDWNTPPQWDSALIDLQPLEAAHRNALLEAASDGALWELWYTSVPSAHTIDAYIETACRQRAEKWAMPFVVLHKPSGRIIGSTRYCRIDEHNRRLEIGYTWYAKSHQRSAVNSACKRLLLQRAFEEYHCIAVEFRTHWFNHASRKAIARLGAKQDGVLRNHQVDAQGRMRDTVVFSIIDREWPSVREALNLALKA